MQKEGKDYNDIFSLVVKYTMSIRVMHDFVAYYDWKLEQLDVKIAFLHDDLEKKIFMCQPKGFEIKPKPDHVSLLKKSLCGLKLSSCQWNKSLIVMCCLLISRWVDLIIDCITCTTSLIKNVCNCYFM